MHDRKTWALALVGAVLIFGAGWLAGEKSAEKNADIAYSVSVDGSIRDELYNEMGWGRSTGDLDNIEAVDVRMGVIRHDGIDAPSPAVSLSIRNNGNQDLDSFGVSYSWQDVTDKKIICRFGQASGDIDAGWTTQSHMYDILEANWAEYMANANPNAEIEVDIWAEGKDKNKQLYRHTFTPAEIASLPDLR